jgi:hypothetical protein
MEGEETNREKFLRHAELPSTTTLSLKDIAFISGFPLKALQLVFNRGIGAWKTSPQSVRIKGTFEKDPSVPRKNKLSKEAWAFSRVYAFVVKSPKVYYGADNDIREKFKLV